MNYVILSSGAYSNYSPQYFVGKKEITQEQLTKKSEEIGTEMWNEWLKLPTRIQPSYLAEAGFPQYKGHTEEVKYDPENLKKYINNSGPDDDEFIKKLIEWLESNGYKAIPNDIPEVNVYYDVPGKPTD